ncbi:PAC2 family protein [Corynebacterium sp. 153RC1]|uniref:PAC2 family protein n=1 Tax=unclassified Corynebacterium TaxID=2624378 RepID=UPI00211D0AA0|nr:MULTISPECIES: PAC2 family protein [unclassified Corynebacterium]MCQ9370730.1 PAC2 family protein [Corynebacterium sp. 35RC1]MCQ9351540.1 PAC2 family protein [Corynebacterium sp. 209RC1]MCQ9353909.1 PAC2 family protein [Corynebacterium sp. 1222RC1]MCQ9355823.1 PAC2 family protein [Corynebacterium sp. 122RC1]MCQ9358067.1 PAC2 family protein [Corynebacterium sp. 142RC1]
MPEDFGRMYELQFPAPEVNNADSQGPTLIVALQGYADAGHAVEHSADHLLAALDHRPVASFNSDELIDYRSRRPAVTIDHNAVVEIEDLHIGMDVVRDSTGKSFLLLSGPEPDLRWEGFTQAVANLVDRFGVSQTICLYAAPMAVPHTRPMVISAHGNSPELVSSQFNLDTRITVPGAAALHLERLLHQQGRKVAGFTAHVPHYLAASVYPQAVLGLLEAAASAADLSLPLRALEEDAAKVAMQIEEQVDGTPEIEQVVHMLERQYDEELERYRERKPHAVMPGESAVPTGEELGEEFERFLAGLDDEPGTEGTDAPPAP